MNKKTFKINCNIQRKWYITYLNFNKETIKQMLYIVENSKTWIWTLKLCINLEAYWFESKFQSLENKPTNLTSIENLEIDLNNL
jgi:hypothetical protein